MAGASFVRPLPAYPPQASRRPRRRSAQPPSLSAVGSGAVPSLSRKNSSNDPRRLGKRSCEMTVMATSAADLESSAAAVGIATLRLRRITGDNYQSCSILEKHKHARAAS